MIAKPNQIKELYFFEDDAFVKVDQYFVKHKEPFIILLNSMCNAIVKEIVEGTQIALHSNDYLITQEVNNERVKFSKILLYYKKEQDKKIFFNIVCK